MCERERVRVRVRVCVFVLDAYSKYVLHIASVCVSA